MRPSPALDPAGYHAMYTHFTDAENTGAPLVPIVDDAPLATDGGQAQLEDLEEVILSHRLED